MPRFVSLDALLDAQYERERLGTDDMTVGSCDQSYIACILDEVPEERTVDGFYDAKPADLVTLFAR